MWEVISAISGTISAICDLHGAQGSPKGAGGPPTSPEKPERLSPKIPSLLLASIGWCLLVVCFVWIAQPFGSYITDREYKEIFAWMIAPPAFLIFLAGIDAQGGTGATAKDDSKTS